MAFGGFDDERPAFGGAGDEDALHPAKRDGEILTLGNLQARCNFGLRVLLIRHSNALSLCGVVNCPPSFLHSDYRS